VRIWQSYPDAIIITYIYLKLKGKDTGVEIFELDIADCDEKRGHQTKIFGYNNEKKVLEQFIEGWCGGGLHKVVSIVEGRSGMGKTTLSDFLVSKAIEQGILIWYVALTNELTTS
jgi:polynucleotide 5'-kinase involved in rRNA processing